MVGSDLEENDRKYEAGTLDFKELIKGYDSLPDDHVVEVIVAFGGSDKDGWRGMKFADMGQIIDDSLDGQLAMRPIRTHISVDSTTRTWTTRVR